MPYTSSLKQPNTQPRGLEMVKTVDLKEATSNLQKLLEKMTEEDNQYIIKSNGQNIAVFLSQAFSLACSQLNISRST